MPSPTVSIVIPSYNHARYLPACLESILSQTFRDWELFLIDDGSRDDSVEIARSYAKKDARIQVETNDKNLGTYGTQKRGLERSSGSYVAIMNSDDLWKPTKLERQVALLESDPAAAYSYVLGAMIDDNGFELDGDVHADWPRSDPQRPLPYLLSDNRILASGVLFRRRTLRFDASCRYSGDWVALLEQSRLGHTRCVAEPLTCWRQHESNSFRRSIPQTAEEIRVRRAIHDSAKAWLGVGSLESEILAGMGTNALHLVPLLVLANDLKQAKAFASYALRHAPNRTAAVKRAVGLQLGIRAARSRFWSSDEIQLSEQGGLRDLVQASQSLEFKTADVGRQAHSQV